MRYRVQSGRPIVRRQAEELDAVQYRLRERDGALALAMAFDPGDAANETLMVHAAHIMLGLLQMRGWRHDGQEMRIGFASDWTDPWWDRPLGPVAFVVESGLSAAGATDAEDVARIVDITRVAWCMERDVHLAERPIPDLMSAFTPGGIVLANIHPEPLRDAMRGHRRSIIERMERLPEPMRSATHAHVLIHLEGTTVRPWSQPGQLCVFGTGSRDPGVDRVFVALEDTAEAPGPETARTLLHLMLASGADD